MFLYEFLLTRQFTGKAAMSNLFLYGSFWFWVLTAVTVVIVFLFSENELGLGGTISFAIYLGLLQWCSDVDPLTYIGKHPLHTLGLVALYFFVGACWGCLKWTLLVKDEDTKKQDVFLNFKETLKISNTTPYSELSEEQKVEFTKVLSRHSLYLSSLKFRDYYGDFTRWVAFWAFNLVRTIFDDFVFRIAQSITRNLSARMQAISDQFNSKWTS